MKIIILIILLIILCVLYFWLRNRIIRKKATAVTIGKITGLSISQSETGFLETATGWEYVYTVDCYEYRKEHLLGITPKIWTKDQMAAHIGEEVVVHYVPDHPGICWVETPDITDR